jgi:hypothetical protein
MEPGNLTSKVGFSGDQPSRMSIPLLRYPRHPKCDCEEDMLLNIIKTAEVERDYSYIKNWINGISKLQKQGILLYRGRWFYHPPPH